MDSGLREFDDLESLSLAAAEFVCGLAQRCAAQKGVFSLALSGGSTPKRLYELLGSRPFNTQMPWDETHIFWGDERCVSVDHPDSNFRMVRNTLLDRILIPSENIHRMPAEVGPPDAAAVDYEKTLRRFFHSCGDFPVFDLVLLGMGTEGHTASLFPKSPVLDETRQWVAGTLVPDMQPAVQRLTLTLPVLNHARCVCFLVSGTAKGKIVKEILEDREKASCVYPAARVQMDHGESVWFVSKE